ncbi:hypothetical protein VTK73DRAFT_9267 [Phialemonium thermophilum]|uniref:Uncharacterized protein n=1 Tax=Phialemonium thermophilum TaxID=223376 RepID=A0ABR3W3I2_9PEZI
MIPCRRVLHCLDERLPTLSRSAQPSLASTLGSPYLSDCYDTLPPPTLGVRVRLNPASCSYLSRTWVKTCRTDSRCMVSLRGDTWTSPTAYVANGSAVGRRGVVVGERLRTHPAMSSDSLIPAATLERRLRHLSQ